MVSNAAMIARASAALPECFDFAPERMIRATGESCGAPALQAAHLGGRPPSPPSPAPISAMLSRQPLMPESSRSPDSTVAAGSWNQLLSPG
jgi:hypothetical protein